MMLAFFQALGVSRLVVAAVNEAAKGDPHPIALWNMHHVIVIDQIMDPDLMLETRTSRKGCPVEDFGEGDFMPVGAEWMNGNPYSGMLPLCNDYCDNVQRGTQCRSSLCVTSSGLGAGQSCASEGQGRVCISESSITCNQVCQIRHNADSFCSGSFCYSHKDGNIQSKGTSCNNGCIDDLMLMQPTSAPSVSSCVISEEERATAFAPSALCTLELQSEQDTQIDEPLCDYNPMSYCELRDTVKNELKKWWPTLSKNQPEISTAELVELPEFQSFVQDMAVLVPDSVKKIWLTKNMMKTFSERLGTFFTQGGIRATLTERDFKVEVFAKLVFFRNTLFDELVASEQWGFPRDVKIQPINRNNPTPLNGCSEQKASLMQGRQDMLYRMSGWSGAGYDRMRASGFSPSLFHMQSAESGECYDLGIRRQVDEIWPGTSQNPSAGISLVIPDQMVRCHDLISESEVLATMETFSRSQLTGVLCPLSQAVLARATQINLALNPGYGEKGGEGFSGKRTYAAVFNFGLTAGLAVTASHRTVPPKSKVVRMAKLDLHLSPNAGVGVYSLMTKYFEYIYNRAYKSKSTNSPDGLFNAPLSRLQAALGDLHLIGTPTIGSAFQSFGIPTTHVESLRPRGYRPFSAPSADRDADIEEVQQFIKENVEVLVERVDFGRLDNIGKADILKVALQNVISSGSREPYISSLHQLLAVVEEHQSERVAEDVDENELHPSKARTDALKSFFSAIGRAGGFGVRDYCAKTDRVVSMCLNKGIKLSDVLSNVNMKAEYLQRVLEIERKICNQDGGTQKVPVLIPFIGAFNPNDPLTDAKCNKDMKDFSEGVLQGELENWIKKIQQDSILAEPPLSHSMDEHVYNNKAVITMDAALQNVLKAMKIGRGVAAGVDSARLAMKSSALCTAVSKYMSYERRLKSDNGPNQIFQSDTPVENEWNDPLSTRAHIPVLRNEGFDPCQIAKLVSVLPETFKMARSNLGGSFDVEILLGTPSTAEGMAILAASPQLRANGELLKPSLDSISLQASELQPVRVLKTEESIISALPGVEREMITLEDISVLGIAQALLGNPPRKMEAPAARPLPLTAEEVRGTPEFILANKMHFTELRFVSGFSKKDLTARMEELDRSGELALGLFEQFSSAQSVLRMIHAHYHHWGGLLLSFLQGKCLDGSCGFYGVEKGTIEKAHLEVVSAYVYEGTSRASIWLIKEREGSLQDSWLAASGDQGTADISEEMLQHFILKCVLPDYRIEMDSSAVDGFFGILGNLKEDFMLFVEGIFEQAMRAKFEGFDSINARQEAQVNIIPRVDLELAQTR